MQHNIAIIPSNDIIQESIALSGSLAAQNPVFTLDGLDYIPHMSLYMAEFDLNEDDLITAIQTVLRGVSSFAVTSNEFVRNDDHYIDISYGYDGGVGGLHRRLLSGLARFRTQHVYKSEDSKGETAERQHFNMVNYGYRWAGDIYRPHITLGKFTSEADTVTAMAKLEYKSYDFSVERIGLFEADELGACRKLLRVFELAQ